MKEYTKKEVCDLLNELYKYIVDSNNTTILQDIEQFKKEKDLIPSLEVGKWYNNGTGLFCYEGEGACSHIGYGFHESYWIESSDYWIKLFHFKEATQEEVEAALIAEAKKRGFKEGVTVDSRTIDKSYGVQNIGVGNFTFTGEVLLYNNWELFRDGKWAEIINTELDELEKAYKEMGEKINKLKESK